MSHRQHESNAARNVKYILVDEAVNEVDNGPSRIRQSGDICKDIILWRFVFLEIWKECVRFGIIMPHLKDIEFFRILLSDDPLLEFFLYHFIFFLDLLYIIHDLFSFKLIWSKHESGQHSAFAASGISNSQDQVLVPNSIKSLKAGCQAVSEVLQVQVHLSKGELIHANIPVQFLWCEVFVPQLKLLLEELIDIDTEISVDFQE